MRFDIRWADPKWEVVDWHGNVVKTFPTLLAAEQYVIERSERSER